MAIHAAEAYDIEAQIAQASITIEALARQIFGDAAYLVRGIHVDMETGDEDVAFEVHYCFPDPENDFDRRATLHEAFMDVYVRTITPDVLSRIILKPIPADAD